MKVKLINLLLLSVIIFSCSRNTVLDKDWSDPEVKSQLKSEVKKDPIFREYIEFQKMIQVKGFLKRGVDFTKIDTAAFLNSANSGKNIKESTIAAGGKVDDEFVNALQKSRSAMHNLIKKYQGLRYFNSKDWQDLTQEELNKNFQENIVPYLREVYKPTN